ncbi:MAG: xanthine dehydrogenase family protein molybdopterin-binding subunit [Candidatus Eisenbacteria bacterium]|nr:xanthine dehydrogenase family protein molybdopterin-binding subunit [Candidatus Eisenbacteria bacterium]
MADCVNDKNSFDVIGSAVPGVDALDKVTGRAKYGADYNQKGQLYGAARHSDYPHAEIVSIDTTRARELPGVRAVLTHVDIPGQNCFGGVVPHQVVLCSDKVRYFGDVVAIVAADTEEVASTAVGLVEIRYNPLPVVTDPVEALREGSPPVHPNGNLCVHHKVRKGDVDKAFSKCDVVLRREYSTQKVEHAYMEPEAVLAELGENGGVTITGSVQNLYSIRRALARVLALPLNRVRIRQATLGGSFGGKDEVMSALACRAALLALATGRPLKMVNTRENSMRESYKRHPYKMRYKVGASKQGLLQAMQIEIFADAGAYAAMSPFVTWRSVVQATGPYVVPNVKTDVYAAYTNNCYTSAMRGFGSPQICFGAESLMDELALELGMSPLEIRLKNVLKDGCETATGQKLDHKVSVEQALLNVARKGNFKEKWNACLEQNKGGAVSKGSAEGTTGESDHDSVTTAGSEPRAGSCIKKGIGLSCSYRGVSLGAEGVDAAGVVVSLQTDGTVIVSSGLVDMGQGASTTISLLVAEELGVTIDRVVFLNADTSRLPDSGPTVASRTSFMAGNAAGRGCHELLERLKPIAAETLKCSPGSVVFEDNFVYAGGGESSTGGGERKGEGMSLAALATLCFQKGISLYAHGWYKAPSTSWDEENGQGLAYYTFVYGANLAEVEVDAVTGKVAVTNVVSSHDVGRVISLHGARGQVCGGVAMGLGYALLEEYAEEAGVPQLENLDEYLLPTAGDTPDVDVVFIENPDKLGPHGAKSLGEPACELAAPAIVNAVANATGRRIRALPLTLERVLLGRKLSRKEERGSVKAKETLTGESDPANARDRDQ